MDQEKDQIYHQLIDMFVEVLEPNIIQDVIQNRNYDFYGALEDLMTLTNSGGCNKDIQNNSVPQKQESLSPEKTSSEEESSGSPPDSDGVLPTNSESLDNIKVSYTNIDEDNEDADIIIEEENEFVFLNSDEVKSNNYSEINSPSEMTWIKDFKSLCSFLSKSKLEESKEDRHVDSKTDEKTNKLKLNPVLEQYQLIKKIPNTFDRVVMLINEKIKVMVLMRGCPGSGKSYLATTVMKRTNQETGKYKEHILSADDYFSLGKEYIFNPEKLSEAHAWNQNRVIKALGLNRSPIIIDNTNTQMWEMRPYAAMAVAYGYDLEILEPETWWSFNDRELTKRNIHGVPKKNIRNMLERYEKNVTVEKLFRCFGLKYSVSNVPPQLVPNAIPTNNIRKRGHRGSKKNKKSISDVALGSPENKGMLPSAPSLELPSFKLASDSNTFETICTYYKSLRFDEASHRGHNIKNNETHDLNTNSTKQIKEQFKTDNNHQVPSCSTNFKDSACGYAPSKQRNIQCKQDISKIKQPVPVAKNFKQTNCLINKTFNSNNDCSFLDQQEYNLLKKNKKKSNSQKNDFDKLNFKDMQINKGELIDKLVKGELQESENMNAASIFNLFANVKKGNNDISFEKDKVKIEKNEAKFDIYEVGSKQENESAVIHQIHPVTSASTHHSTSENMCEENIRINGNMCRQFVMYTPEGFIYSDPVYNISPSDKNIERLQSKNSVMQIENDVMCNETRHSDNVSYPYTMESLIQRLTTKEVKEMIIGHNSENINKTETSVVQFDEGNNRTSVDKTENVLSYLFPSQEKNGNEKHECLQENSCENLCRLSVHSGLSNVSENVRSINTTCSHQITSENVRQESVRMNENVCRQFLMYTPEGFLHSDPVYSISPADDTNKSENIDPLHSENTVTQIENDVMCSETRHCDNFESTLKTEKMNINFIEGNNSLLECQENNFKFENVSTQKNVNNTFLNAESVPIDEMRTNSIHTVNIIGNSNLLGNEYELKINSFANFKNEDVLIPENDNLKVLTTSVSTQPTECGNSFYNVASTFVKDDTLTIQKKQLPQIDLMSLFEGNNSSKNPTNSEERKSTETVNNSPKPARENLKTRTQNSIFSYPITKVEISPDIALWDTVNDPDTLWSTSTVKDNKMVIPEKYSKCDSKPQRQYVKKGNQNNTGQVEVTDSATNTSYSDFDPRCDLKNEKLLICKNRNICEGIVLCSQTKNKSPVLLLDKGTMTSDMADETKINLDELVSLFPHLQGDALIELVEKCQGDLNWVLDLLLESDQVNLPDSYHSADLGLNSNSSESDKNQDTNQVNPNLSGARKKIPKHDKKQVLKKSVLELKELIEKSIVLDESHYSDHILKIMKKKRDLNKKEDSQQVVSDNKTLDANEKSVCMIEEQNVKKEMSFFNHDIQQPCHSLGKKLEEATKGITISNLVAQNVDYDIDSDKLDEIDDDEDDDLIQLAVGKDFIMQLQQKFGCSVLPDMIEDSTVIELPASLACQLHCYVLDSIQRQMEHQQEIMDKMIREDEEFARQLQEQEDNMEERNGDKPAPLLQEIMDMEMALAFYKADQNEWRQQSQNTMAAKLSMQLLTQSFPNVDKNVLMEVFQANNYSLHDTVESLNLFLSDQQPDLVRREEELIAKLETVKSQEPNRCAIVVSDIKHNSNPRQEVLQEAEECRKQASCYYQLRNDCFKKAQDALRSGNPSVASYYSQLAALHKDRTEFFNSQAAACLFQARARSSTLDLHFLRVVEAVEVLDIFLDEEISQLTQSKKRKSVVYLITGRGLRSVGGVSRIKPIVQRRLRERKIIYNEMNPGMLRAVLTRNTQLTCNV